MFPELLLYQRKREVIRVANASAPVPQQPTSQP